VTVHWIDAGVDSGDIIAQRAWSLERETRAVDLYMRRPQPARRCWRRSCRISTRCRRTPQDASRATTNPSPNKRTWSIDYATWPAARVWHFLNGMSSLRRDLLDVPYVADAFTLRETQHGRAPGTIVARAGKIAIYCNDGIVEGKQLPWRRASRALAQANQLTTVKRSPDFTTSTSCGASERKAMSCPAVGVIVMATSSPKRISIRRLRQSSFTKTITDTARRLTPARSRSAWRTKKSPSR